MKSVSGHSLLLTAAAAACWTGSTALAQDNSIVGEGRPAQEAEIRAALEAAAAQASASSAAGENGGARDTPAAKALELLRKAAFVRTPGLVLQEWAGLEEPKPPQQAGAQPAQPAQPETPPDPLQKEIDALRRDVALGRWEAIGEFLRKHFAGDAAQAGQAYRHVLTSLAGTARRQPNPGQPPPQIVNMRQLNQPNPAVFQRMAQERSVVAPEEVLELAAQAPDAPDDEVIRLLGDLLSAALDEGCVLDGLLARLQAGAGGFGGTDPAGRLRAARLLVAAKRPVEAGPYLPDPSDARRTANTGALDLLALAAMGRHDQSGRAEDLEAAWKLTHDVLALTNPGDEHRAGALTRAVELASKVRRELAQEWIVECFTTRREIGREILASIGRAVIASRRSPDFTPREAALELQSRAVGALLDAVTENTAEWTFPLSLLARNWLVEAEWTQMADTSVTRGPQMQYDPYGNVYFVDESYFMQQNDGGRPRAVPTGRMLDFAPGKAWIDAVEPSLRPALLRRIAELHLKVRAEEDAFPFIEALAATHPAQAQELADRFIEVWGENHDPNANNRRTSRYMYIYGYNPQAGGIPLTRSKQTRNLTELAEWVRRLRALPAVKVDESKIMAAFLRTHSAAEVYRLEDIVQVFGEPGEMKAETIAGMLQTMRANLAGVWRDPRVQQEQKTKRTDKEIVAEVLRGYARAASLLDSAQERYPKDWRLQLVRAALMTDENNFRNEQEQSTGFAAKRAEAFQEFARAASLYAEALPELDVTAQTADVYLTWFYAAMGASDLEGVKADHVPAAGQPALIRQAILSLPGDAAERHLTLFANALSTRMTAAAPAVKHRYLKYGLEIAGDNERARSARELFDYYGDLVTEIRLVAGVDGPASVGTEPFGVFVNIHHTREIERESGGFQRYLQNQNSQTGFYNFGRPPENYRDKFEEAARAALGESFDVISVTFHPDKVQSRGGEEDGWRVTPYCYILMKARGPEVDTVPSLRMDLDFLDTSGYAVLPISSSPLQVTAKEAEDRPCTRIEVQQILDERKAPEGILALEIKATGRGLVPDLDRLLTLGSPGFVIDRIDGSPARVVQLEPGDDLDADETAVSDRTWNVIFRADPEAAAPASSFEFGKPISGDITTKTYRYADADLQEVPGTVKLEERYAGGSRWWWILLPIVLLAGGAGALGYWWLRRRKPDAVASGEFAMPSVVTPLSVIGLLHRIRRSGRVQGTLESDLIATLSRMEARFYSPGSAPDGEEPDPAAIAREWIRRVENPAG